MCCGTILGRAEPEIRFPRKRLRLLRLRLDANTAIIFGFAGPKADIMRAQGEAGLIIWITIADGISCVRCC
jgi:hypothetical protein